MFDYLISLDTEILLWFNSHHNGFWDNVMTLATGKLIWIPMYVALLIAFCRAYGWKSAATAVVLTVLAVTAADQITASLLRPYFERLRPTHTDNPVSELLHIVDGYRRGGYGFPSCHAANTFAVFTFTSLVFNRWKYTVFILSWALLNCYSRVYLGVHYPGDLLVGSIIGMMCGAMAYLLGSVIVRIFNLEALGNKDRLGRSFLFGKIISYRPSDIVIIVGLMVMAYIAIYGFIRE